MELNPDDIKQPMISLIIPTLNEEEYVGKLLESLSIQSYPLEKFEILLFDGGSDDSTLKVVEDHQGKLDIKIFHNEKVRQVYAWNDGIGQSKGDYFIILGAHSYLDKYFIENSLKTFQEIKTRDSALAAVGGSLEIVYKNRVAKLIKLLYTSPFAGVSGFWSKNESGYKETVVFGLYDKKSVINAGKFDEDFIIGDDYELNLRLNKQGYKLYSNPEIKSYYFSRSSPRGFLKQSFQYGAVKGLCIRTGYNRLIWWVPLLFLAFELIVLASLWTPLFPTMIFLLCLYFLLSIIYALYVAVKSREPLALSLMLFHFVFHNTVALGFLKGFLWGRRTFR